MMILDVLQWLGHAYALYRATQDAGMWIFQMHTEATQNYMESFLISRGML